MDDMTRRPVPGWYWAVAVLALLWEAIGCYFYIVQVSMDAADLAALPPAQAEAFGAMAQWQWAVFAIAVWSGLLGAVGLLLRKAWAYWLLLLSLIAAVIQYGYVFAATPILETMPVGEALGLPISITVIGIILVWFAGSARKRRWLN